MAQPISAAQSGSGWRSSLRDRCPAAERPVDDDADAALPRQRQDALLDLAVDDVVGHLHEVDRMARHDPFELVVAAAFRGRDADIADRPSAFIASSVSRCASHDRRLWT